jgi:hypothetical protein
VGQRRESPSYERVLGELFQAPDPAHRAAGFLAAVVEILGARAAALCRPFERGARAGEWFRTAVCGDADGLPSADQVAAVVAGELEPYLPPRRAILVANGGLALVLDGADPEDDAIDDVEGLLFAYAAIAAADGLSDGLDEVRGATG